MEDELRSLEEREVALRLELGGVEQRRKELQLRLDGATVAARKEAEFKEGSRDGMLMARWYALAAEFLIEALGVEFLATRERKERFRGFLKGELRRRVDMESVVGVLWRRIGTSGARG